MCLPLIVWCGEPLVIVQPEWPGMGQLHVSPTQATGMPWTLKCDALALITLPPWVVTSPSLMTFFMAFVVVESEIYLTAVATSLSAGAAIDLILRNTSPRDSCWALRFSSEGGLMKMRVASCGSRRLTARLGPPAR